MTEREQQPASLPRFRRLRVPKGVGVFLHDPKAKVASFILLVVIFFAAFGPTIAPFGENEQNLRASLEAPSWTHPLGTDQLGRDILTRAMYGSRVSVSVGLIVVAIAAAVALPIGAERRLFRRLDRLCPDALRGHLDLDPADHSDPGHCGHRRYESGERHAGDRLSQLPRLRASAAGTDVVAQSPRLCHGRARAGGIGSAHPGATHPSQHGAAA